MMLFFTIILMSIMMSFMCGIKLLNWIILIEAFGLLMLLNFFICLKNIQIDSIETSVFIIWIFVCESSVMLTFYILYYRSLSHYCLKSLDL